MKKYVIENAFFKLTLLNVGASMFSLIKKDTNTNMIVTRSEKEYLTNSEYHGAIVGPTAGRICNKNIEIENKKYVIPNFKRFLLHSGNPKICVQKWKMIKKTQSKIVFNFNYQNKKLPFLSGQNVFVTYKLKNKKVICTIKSLAKDAKIMNFTNHVYFSLGSKNVKNLLLKVNHSQMIETEKDGFITGKILKSWPEELTFNDFKKTKNIDNVFIFQKNNQSALLQNPQNNVSLKVKTNQKAVVIYNDCHSKNEKYKGIAIECQGFPSAINYKNFEQNVFNKRKNKIIWTFDF